MLFGPPGVAAVNDAIFPTPGSESPMDVLSFVQSNTVAGTEPDNKIGAVASPSQYSKSPGFTTFGMGCMVMVSPAGMLPLQVPLEINNIGVKF
jgi:hypothetical protein